MAAITNGVHTATWVGPEMGGLFDRVLQAGWRGVPDDPATGVAWCTRTRGRSWEARTAQRARLLERVDAMARAEGLAGLPRGSPPNAPLVLGFARRFATYKRAGLLLADPERLMALLAEPARLARW